MDMQPVLDWLVAHVPMALIILQVLGSLVVAATIFVGMTPNQDDDALLLKVKTIPIVGSLIEALERFSLILRK